MRQLLRIAKYRSGIQWNRIKNWYRIHIRNLSFCSVDSHWTKSGIVSTIEADSCCYDCAAKHNGPGKFEKYSWDVDFEYLDGILAAEDMGKALILSEWANNGSEDDFMSNEGWGYCGRFGSYLLYDDDRGFTTFDEYPSIEAAEKAFMRWYKDGWGASEDDAYISRDWHRGYEVSFNGKPLKVWPNNNGEISERRALARIRLEMMKTGFYPNVWKESDHGNLTLVENL